MENQRLRNLLRITNGVEPAPEQPTLAPADPGLVTNSSPQEAKLALYWRLFAARRDVYASYWSGGMFHERDALDLRVASRMAHSALSERFASSGSTLIGEVPLRDSERLP